MHSTNFRAAITLVGAFLLALSVTSPAHAACPPDSARVGASCVDLYEASVWDLSQVPAANLNQLVHKIRAGTVTLPNLVNHGAVQRGVSSDDYPCDDNGNDCTDIYAVSIAGVMPSSFITWFQSQQAAANSGKRLLTNAEWQQAAAGTPDPGSTLSTPLDCNIQDGIGPGVDGVVLTGSRANCVSRFGVFDMVGNLWEWVADWVPLSTNCVTPMFPGSINCFAGADTNAGPGALIRGGDFGGPLGGGGNAAGVFAIYGRSRPERSTAGGFRAGRSA